VRVARIGLVTVMVNARKLLRSMPQCVHDRRSRRVADAVQSPPTLRHGKFPPLRATPAGEDAALQGRRRAPRRLARESGGRRVARFGARRTGAAVVTHLWHPLLQIRQGTLFFVRPGFCCGLLMQGPRRLSLLQRPPASLRKGERPNAARPRLCAVSFLHRGSPGPNSWPGWARSFLLRARGVVVTSGSSHSSPIRGRSMRWPPAGAGPLRTGDSQAGEGQDGFARVKQHLRQSRRSVDRPPTGPSSSRSTTTAASFKRRRTICP
jgi:hypothetical protein